MPDEDISRAQVEAQVTTEGRPEEDTDTFVHQYTEGDAATPNRILYHGSRTNPPAMDMGSVANALPDYNYHAQQQQQQQLSPLVYGQPLQLSSANASMMYPYPPAQYNNPSSVAYPVAYPQQMPLQYQQQRPYATYPLSHTGHSTHNFGSQIYFPSQPMLQGQAQTQFQHFSQSPFPQMQGGALGRAATQYQSQPGFMAGTTQLYQPGVSHNTQSMNPSPSVQTTSSLRGPPRKPKQSGYALWVGNLPPGTSILDLKDHFSRDLTDQIESVFLISKSNCAFVNYKSEQSCTVAMNKFHDSRFQGIRLVCRLRRGSTPNSNPASNQAVLPSSSGQAAEERGDADPKQLEDSAAEGGLRVGEQQEKVDSKVKDKYFIIKSLTMEDLERSVHTGIWATQSHNEVALNKAYQEAENVYLIFSANKSGEYFGYARMDSAIDDESVAELDPAIAHVDAVSRKQTSSIADIPRTILTPSTATAPKGHIIDDSARGTIFWEAESEIVDDEVINTPIRSSQSDSGELSAEETPTSRPDSPAKDTPTQNTTFGKPFRISWMSTDRLPFYRTRGLRNPWNTNREVKIARDGTELEPNVGRKLIGMFGTTGGGPPRPLQTYPAVLGQSQGFGRPY